MSFKSVFWNEYRGVKNTNVFYVIIPEVLKQSTNILCNGVIRSPDRFRNLHTVSINSLEKFWSIYIFLSLTIRQVVN